MLFKVQHLHHQCSGVWRLHTSRIQWFSTCISYRWNRAIAWPNCPPRPSSHVRFFFYVTELWFSSSSSYLALHYPIAPPPRTPLPTLSAHHTSAPHMLRSPHAPLPTRSAPTRSAPTRSAPTRSAPHALRSPHAPLHPGSLGVGILSTLTPFAAC